MSPLRLISIDEAKARLRSYGCKPLAGKGRLNTAEWWQWPWGGAPFLLPFDGDVVDEWALQRLIADMAKLAPAGWAFPVVDDRPQDRPEITD